MQISKASALVDLPEMAKTEQQLVSMVSDFYMDALDAHEPFLNHLVDAFGFYDGTRQWMEIDPLTGKMQDGKAILNKRGLPALTKNFIFPLINLLGGVETNEQLQVKCVPRTSEDTPFADGMSEIITKIWDKQKVNGRISQTFNHASICGRGWLAVEQVEDDKNLFATKTKISLLDPGEVIFDRKSRENDLSDCDYVIREKIVNRALAIMTWPDKAYELQAYYSFLNSMINSNRISDNRLMLMRKDICITECWYRVHEMRKLLVDSVTGQVRDVSQIPNEQLVPFVSQFPELDVIQKKQQVMKFVQTVGDAVHGVHLDSGPSPYDDNLYPLVPMFAYRGRDMDFGVVFNAMDSQREINKRDSQILHYINKLNRTRVITDDDELALKLEQGMEIITVKSASINNLKIIPPPPFPDALARIEEKNEQHIPRITGISDDLRGIKSGNDSGAVVDIRRQQSMNNVALLLRNRLTCAEQVGQLIMSRVRQFMSPAEIARVLGPTAHPLVIQAIKQLDVHEYDMSITQSPSSPTLRAENLQRIAKLIEFMPGLANVAPDIIIDAFDVSQKAELIARLSGQVQQQQPPQNGGQGNKQVETQEVRA